MLPGADLFAAFGGEEVAADGSRVWFRRSSGTLFARVSSVLGLWTICILILCWPVRKASLACIVWALVHLDFALLLNFRRKKKKIGHKVILICRVLVEFMSLTKNYSNTSV